MSVQRFTLADESRMAMTPALLGQFVTYADHEAALAAARADAIRECVAAVEAVEHWASYSPDGDVWACFASDPIAALRALLPEADA